MSPRSRADRVARSHGLAIAAFRLGGGFLVAAVVWGVVTLTGEGVRVWWGPLHAFMAGTVLLAISGATQLFTTTWSAAPPVDRRVGAVQRWLLALGAVGVVVAYPRRLDGLLIVSASLVAAALATLAGMLRSVVRHSLLRRFDWSTRCYLLAAASGLVGVTLGAIVGAGGTPYLDLRTAHMHLNLIGLVGFTIMGTLPTLLATTVRHRMVSGDELRFALAACALAVPLMTSGVWVGPEAVGVGAGLAAVSLLVVLAGIVIRLGPARVLTAGFPAVMITSGALWLAGWAAHQAVILIAEGHRVYAAATTVGVSGVAMVLFGSLAYLIPVLAGPGERLPANFARMQGWGWPRVVVANAVPLTVVTGVPTGAAVALAGLFLSDFLIRVATMVARGRAHPS